MADKAIKLAEELLAEGVTDILVMSPVKKDHGGRNDVNDQMKQHFNPENKNVPPLRFSIADPIIATKNNYRDEIMVMNGQIGSVSSINLSAIEAAKNMPREEADTFPVVTVDFHEFTGEKVLSVIEAAQFELAYCITIHKSQGNQASAALCLLPPTGEGFYMKELPFTAVTRGVNFAWVITPSPEIFKRYLVNNNRINRISLLGKFLSGILQ
jgi:exodeoxyribonuclease V alpha subunit